MHFQPFEPSVTQPDIYYRAVADAEAAAAAAKAAESPEDTAPSPQKLNWGESFTTVLLDGSGFVRQEVPARPRLLGEFLRAGDLGFLYAPRGVGKTWQALLMSKAIATGAALGEWTAGNAGPQRVCYVDGEVNLPDAVERALLTGLPASVHWLHHESVVEAAGRCLNLADVSQQEGLLEMLLAQNITVLVLDNLSCLFRGVAENEADAWELVLTWLLQLRRHRITVILVAHAGRNGEMRGTSRREDNAHWVLKLEDAGDSESEGAEYKSVFTKNRNAKKAGTTCPPLLWKLRTEDDRLLVDCTRHSDVEHLAELVNSGVTSGSDLAEELGVSKGTVSKWAKRAAERGLIRIENREYLPL